jgi:N-acetylneuraminic acid mutarotase
LAGGAVFKDKMWLFDGVRESDAWQSTDGATWTAVAQTAPFSPRYGHCVLAFENKLWILGGYGPEGTQINDVWSSTDGAAWTQVTPAADWSPRDNFGCVVFAGKMWVIDGAREGDVWTSTDGAHWTEVTPTAPFTPVLSLQSVAWNNELWTMGGEDPSGAEVNDVFHSPDGVVWTKMANVPWSPRVFFSALVFKDKAWVIDGDVRDGAVWKLE